MPKFEIELTETGELVGAPPTELDALFKRTETTAHGAGYTKAKAEAEEAAKARVEAAIAAERARLEALDPIKKDQYERETNENKALKTQMLDLSRSHSDALKSQEERHAAALLERSDKLKKYGERIVGLTKDTLKGLATRYGAREDSLAALELVLHAGIAYDDDMQPYVKNPQDGSRRTAQGKDISLEAYVKEVLESQPYFKKPAAAGGGGARGGASQHGFSGANVTAEAAKARIENGDRTADAINDLFLASRRKRAAS